MDQIFSKRSGAAIGAILALLLSPVPVRALEPENPGQMMEEGVRHLLDALGAILNMIPIYEKPEMLPNGDIIIRRKKPEQIDPDKKEGEGDDLRT